MEIKKKKIGIITTVCNWDLYEKTKQFFPSGIKIFAIDGTKGLYGIKSMVFFMEKLKKHDLDWLIMADEDVVFTHPDRVFDLINYLDKNNYTVCGMSEANRLEKWTKHPYVINTFFGILNIKEIYDIYNRKEMLSNQYIIKNEFSQKMEGVPFYEYEINSLMEPYYCFFLWLLRNGKKTKFLKASNPYPDDFATTLMLDHQGKELLNHTWYARQYNKDKFHTERIKKIINKGQANIKNPTIIVLRNYFFNTKSFLYGYYRKFRRKIIEK